MLVNKGGCRAGGPMAMRDGTGADASTGRGGDESQMSRDGR